MPIKKWDIITLLCSLWIKNVCFKGKVKEAHTRKKQPKPVPSFLNFKVFFLASHRGQTVFDPLLYV